MKHFLKKLTIYLTLLLSVIVVLTLLHQYLFNKDAESTYIIPKEKIVLALGDSHMQGAFNDNLYEEFINKSTSDEPRYYQFMKAKKILTDSTNNIKIVVLSYNRFTLNGNGPDSLFYSDARRRYYDLYRPFHQDYENRPSLYGFPIDSMEYLKEYIMAKINFPNSQSIQNKILSGTFASINYIGGFSPHKNHTLRMTPEQIRQRGEGMIMPKEDCPENLGGKSLDMIKRIARLVRARGGKLVLLATPCHKYYNEAVYDELDEYYANTAKELNDEFGEVYYLDYLRMELPDSCYKDANHLNYMGANIFTPMLRDTLISLGLY